MQNMHDFMHVEFYGAAIPQRLMPGKQARRGAGLGEAVDDRLSDPEKVMTEMKEASRRACVSTGGAQSRDLADVRRHPVTALEGAGRAIGKPSQAMNTAMKANRKINTPPTTGRTIGISGTIASTGSFSAATS